MNKNYFLHLEFLAFTTFKLDRKFSCLDPKEKTGNESFLSNTFKLANLKSLHKFTILRLPYAIFLHNNKEIYDRLMVVKFKVG